MKSLLEPVVAFYASSIGKKLIVAVTGIALLGFLFGHMVGNLKIFLGPEKLNGYAAWLHSMPGLLWGARIGLISAFGLHIVTTITLVIQNRAARDTRYEHEKTVQAPGSSRIMMISGSIILAFVVFHILHFTVGVASGYYDPSGDYFLPDGHHDVYKMVVHSFSQVPAISLFYILSMALLCSHLSHGVASVFQTLGLRTERSWPLIRAFGYAYAALIFFGNISIPIAAMAGWIK
ncbi:MAG: succinate dehydrogenase / fumarate reductase cytochrome b subunit [Verrucomicrobiales bacterium]|jgi:succinate dehydrogenase / fumarate reductase cytochrome b subunit